MTDYTGKYAFILAKVELHDDELTNVEAVCVYENRRDALNECKRLNQMKAHGVFLTALGEVSDFDYRVDDRFYYKIIITEFRNAKD